MFSIYQTKLSTLPLSAELPINLPFHLPSRVQGLREIRIQ